MKNKYTHFEDEVSGEIEPSLGYFLLQMFILGGLIALFIIKFY